MGVVDGTDEGLDVDVLLSAGGRADVEVSGETLECVDDDVLAGVASGRGCVEHALVLVAASAAARATITNLGPRRR